MVDLIPPLLSSPWAARLDAGKFACQHTREMRTKSNQKERKTCSTLAHGQLIFIYFFFFTLTLSVRFLSHTCPLLCFPYVSIFLFFFSLFTFFCYLSASFVSLSHFPLCWSLSWILFFSFPFQHNFQPLFFLLSQPYLSFLCFYHFLILSFLSASLTLLYLIYSSFFNLKFSPPLSL